MPLPTDPTIVQTSTEIVQTLHEVFGPHPGFRPAHAKGILLSGTFTPTKTAAELSKGQHFNASQTPVIARFSSSTGLPQLPDTDAQGNPRGLAIRFLLASTPIRRHTDIIAHSTPRFPVRTGEEFHQLFQSVKTGAVPEFLASHPKAREFFEFPKPFPRSFASEAFFSVSALKLVALSGKETFIRYRLVPDGGINHLSEDDLRTKSDNYLYDELRDLLQRGHVGFRLQAQIAREGDVVDDATSVWPEDRSIVDLGMITLDSLVEENDEEQRKIIFDPVPRIDGVESAGDPLMDTRAAVYLLSGRERRSAK